MRTIIYSPGGSGSFFSWPEGSGPFPEGCFESRPERFGDMRATNKIANINSTRPIVSIIQVSLATLTCRHIGACDNLAPEAQRREVAVARDGWTLDMGNFP